MKLVVDIPEEHLKTLRQLSGLGYYHEVIAKGQPLSEILDKISAEIKALDEGITSYVHDDPWIYKREALEVIDNVRKEAVSDDISNQERTESLS